MRAAGRCCNQATPHANPLSCHDGVALELYAAPRVSWQLPTVGWSVAAVFVRMPFFPYAYFESAVVSD